MTGPGYVKVDGTWISYDTALDLLAASSEPKVEAWEGDVEQRLVFIHDAVEHQCVCEGAEAVYNTI